MGKHEKSISSKSKFPTTKPYGKEKSTKSPPASLSKSPKVLRPKLKGKAIEKPRSPSPSQSENEEEDESEDETSSDDEISLEEEEDENGGVDEEGMARLMKALGKDGQDEFLRAQLEALSEGVKKEKLENKEDEAQGGEEDNEVDENNEDEEQSGEEDLEVARDEDEDQDQSGEDESEDEEHDVENEHELAALSDESSEDGEGEGNMSPTQLHEIPMDDASSVDEDAVPHQKIEIDNKVALQKIRKSIKLDSSFPWTETLVLSYPNTIDVDVNDDLNRELAFYKQALHSAQEARTLASKQKPPFPFTRPSDYFAEMVKTDAHMERIRIRLLNESSSIKKSEDKRKEREGKKFGKQVQIEKLKERQRNKKEIDEKLKSLKRKRKDVLDKPRENDDDFDVAVEDAIAERPPKRGKASNGRSIPRSVRDKKYGFGRAGRHAKQNTRESTDNFDPSKIGRSKKGGKGGGSKGRHKTKRLGKSRRMAAKSKS